MHIKRRLDIKAPPPDSSSGSDREVETLNANAELGLGVSAISNVTQNEFISLPKFPKTDHNIQLEKYTVITDEVEDTTGSDISTTLEINPELQSRWATMNLGVSRFRKRLENENASTQSASEGWRKEASQNSSSLYVAHDVDIKRDQPQSQTELVQRKAGIELESQTHSGQPHLSLSNIPRIRRALDIRAHTEPSPGSSSEADTQGLGFSDMSLGLPLVKRRLDVKAPIPTTYSRSESEIYATGSSLNRSRPASNPSTTTADDSLITYKRVIMKTLSLPSNASSLSGEGQPTDYKQRFVEMESVAPKAPSFASKRVLGTIFNDGVKKRSEQPGRITGVGVPSEIRWTGVGRHLDDLSVPTLRRHLDVDVSSPPAESELPPPDNVSLSSSRAVDTLKAASETRTERKGLGALKAMSSERRKWDTIDEDVALYASPRDYGPRGDARLDYRKSEEEFKAATSRVTDFAYDVPRYRRHDIGGKEAPQEAQPPIPATSPPYEAAAFTWRSPQSANKPSGGAEESVLLAFSQFANENISEV
ncbi:hypothetical protein EYF80_046908 [Liparis tanakae]|uniref:Uncharacterized protein n=1 Tax=Liparis tanakae TaxID=230148 RepID=A0A4Z2FPS4_9TELE|nr:hypothetical protein EYF80_046908 [Liparis tanakae]